MCFFSDVHTVWLGNPFPLLADNRNAGYATQWMDDGARQSKFAPFFTSSRFFYLANTHTTVLFWRQVAYNYDLVIEWDSYQMVTNWLLAQFYRTGMRIKVLNREAFVPGKLSNKIKLNAKSGAPVVALSSDAVDSRKDDTKGSIPIALLHHIPKSSPDKKSGLQCRQSTLT